MKEGGRVVYLRIHYHAKAPVSIIPLLREAGALFPGRSDQSLRLDTIHSSIAIKQTCFSKDKESANIRFAREKAISRLIHTGSNF